MSNTRLKRTQKKLKLKRTTIISLTNKLKDAERKYEPFQSDVKRQVFEKLNSEEVAVEVRITTMIDFNILYIY